MGCMVVSLVCALYPMYVIRPFRAQGAFELEVALFLLRVRPALTAFNAVIMAVAFLCNWRQNKGWLARLVASAALLVTIGGAAISRVNLFERMFHPLDTVSGLDAADAKLDLDDMLLSVQLKGAARGYPVRAIAYHHVVNDVVGGEPIVATY